MEEELFSLVAKLVVPIFRHKLGGIHVPHGTEGDLDPLQGVHYHKAQLAAEHLLLRRE